MMERPAQCRPFCCRNRPNPRNFPDFVNQVTRYCRPFDPTRTSGVRKAMALRLSFGSVFRVFRPRWGVRGSLFAAFAVIAGMAIVISAGAGMVLHHLSGTMVDLSARDIPRLSASLQLAAQSASLASQGPALLVSQND